MQKKDKAVKRKKILLVRNMLLVVLAALAVAIVAQGYRTFFRQEESKAVIQEGSENRKGNGVSEETGIPGKGKVPESEKSDGTDGAAEPAVPEADAEEELPE